MWIRASEFTCNRKRTIGYPPENAVRDRRRPLLISACTTSFGQPLPFSLAVRWRESLINQIAYARPSALVHVPQVLDRRRSTLSPWTIDPLSVGQEGRDPLLAL